MARGELSFSQARAITRIADDENELELLAEARKIPAAGLERRVRAWKRVGRKDEAALEAQRHASRFFSVCPDDDGGYRVRGKLDPEVGAPLMRAIEAASDALYRGSAPAKTPEQRRADALAFLIERALAAGFGRAGEEKAEGRVSAEALRDHGDGSAGRLERADGGVSAETLGGLSPATSGKVGSDASAEAHLSHLPSPWNPTTTSSPFT